MAKAPEKKQAKPQPKRARQKVKMVSGPLAAEELYVDGVNSIFGRLGVIKLDCYRVVGYERKSNTEIRSVTHRLVLPAAAVPGMVRLFQDMAKAGRQSLDDATAQAADPKKNS